jgi:3-dehydroquinate dehydratase type I
MIFGIITAPMLAARRYPAGVWECDGVELRADGLPPSEVVGAVESFAEEKKRRGFSGPVVFTLRLRRDGGAWEDARALERESLWQALAGPSVSLCDIVDIEIEEVASLSESLWQDLRQKKMRVMLSHHAFTVEDVTTWKKELAAMRNFRPDAVKFAVTVRNLEETKSLLRFARAVAAQFSLSCVIGMGEAGQATRILSPLLGCPITYAFLEEGPVAPGQLPLEVLRSCFATTEGRPAPGAGEEEWLDWAGRILQKIRHAR